MRKKPILQMSGFMAHEGDDSWRTSAVGGAAISPRMMKAIMDGSATNVITTPRPDPSSKTEEPPRRRRAGPRTPPS